MSERRIETTTRMQLGDSYVEVIRSQCYPSNDVSFRVIGYPGNIEIKLWKKDQLKLLQEALDFIENDEDFNPKPFKVYTAEPGLGKTSVFIEAAKDAMKVGAQYIAENRIDDELQDNIQHDDEYAIGDVVELYREGRYLKVKIIAIKDGYYYGDRETVGDYYPRYFKFKSNEVVPKWWYEEMAKHESRTADDPDTDCEA